MPVKKSVTENYIVSLEDGRRLKALKRYLAGLGMTPDDYRAKWGLPSDYPMVAPGYRTMRVEHAKRIGLGNSRWPQTQAADVLERTALSPAKIETVERQEATLAPLVEKMQPEPIADDAPVMGAVTEQPARRRGRPKKAPM